MTPTNDPDLETLFTPKEDCTFLSSRIVKEIARFGGDVRAFVPERSALGLAKHYPERA